MKKKMLFLIALAIVAAVSLPCGKRGRLNAKELPETDAQITKLLSQCVDEQKRTLGIVVAVVDTNGTRIFAKGVSKDGGPAVNGDTLFEIGSITKTFTALLLQQMVDSNEVRLDDPISKYLPASVKAPTRNGKEITLLDLATQSSGLPRLPGNLAPKDQANPYVDYTPDRLYRFLSHYELKRDIGSKYEYSNLGVGLLGQVLALRLGTNYEAAVVQRICVPLGLKSTRAKLSPELKTRFATGYNESGVPVEYWDFDALAGCGALRSSANDLARYIAMNMGVTPSPLSDAMNKARQPLRPAGRGEKIGLVWMTETRSKSVWHNGGTYGFSSFVGFKADGSRGVVVLANSGNTIDDLGEALLGDRAELDDFDAPKTRKVAKVSPSVFDDFAGKYKFPGAPVTITMTRDGDRLFGQMTGQQRIEFFPESETVVFCTVVDAKMTFVRDSTGKVTHLVLHQNGLDQKAMRVN